MYPDLRNKTALVTGCGKKSGIGYAIARKLARCGVNIILSDLPAKPNGKASADLPDLASLAAELAETCRIQAMAAELDVTQADTLAQMVSAVTAQFESVDILCNNAGAVFGVPNAVHTYDETAWLKTIDVNLHGVFRVSKALVPLMLKNGGCIINVASRAAKVPPLFNGAYAVAKAGVVMLTKVMAKELAGNRIRVNAVCPGVIDTDFTRWRFDLEARILNSSIKDRETEMIKSIPAGRLGKAEEVADLVLFLASDASAYITGQALNITGGQLMEL